MELDDDSNHDFLPDPNNVIRYVNRLKAKKRPKDPSMDSEIKMDYKGVDPSFLIADLKIEEEEDIVARNLIFATPFQLEILHQCSTIYVDGTFKCCRDPFKQFLGYTHL